MLIQRSLSSVMDDHKHIKLEGFTRNLDLKKQPNVKKDKKKRTKQQIPTIVSFSNIYLKGYFFKIAKIILLLIKYF